MVRHLHSHKKIEHKKKKKRLRDRNFFFEEGRDFSKSAPQNVLGISDRELTKMFDRAWEMLEFHETADAVRAFTLLCYIHPYISDSWYGLALAFRDSELYEEAVSALFMAETIEPNRFEFYREAIECCILLGNKREAQHIFHRMHSHRRSIDGFDQLDAECSYLRELVDL